MLLCAQSCQRSLGRIVDKVAATGSEEKEGAAEAQRGDDEEVIWEREDEGPRG